MSQERIQQETAEFRSKSDGKGLLYKAKKKKKKKGKPKPACLPTVGGGGGKPTQHGITKTALHTGHKFTYGSNFFLLPNLRYGIEISAASPGFPVPRPRKR